MSILDEITASFGPDALKPSGTREIYDRWCQVCTCGHLDVHHSESVGGGYQPITGTTRAPDGGPEWDRVQQLNGCVGAMVKGGYEEHPESIAESRVVVMHVTPTCPCVKFQPLAKVNRPNRAFNQRMPVNRSDHSRHPFITGIRAFTTHLSKRKAADPERGGSPEWATAEFSRRFTWLDGARVCGISRCTKSDGDVWPCFVSDDGRSELRCGAHRPG
jgi:hypothetical protein